MYSCFSIQSHSFPRLKSQMKRLRLVMEQVLVYLNTSSLWFDNFVYKNLGSFLNFPLEKNRYGIGEKPRFWIFFFKLFCINLIQHFTFNTHSNDPKKSTAKNYFLCPIFKTNIKLIFILTKYTNPKLARSNYWMQSRLPD